MWILVLEGSVIGLLLGLTGAGGGILAVPALMLSQGWTVSQAAPVGLLAVTLAAMLGAGEGLIKKMVRYKAAIWIALFSIPFARYGVHLAGLVSAFWLTIAFCVVMLIVAYRVFFNKLHDVQNPPCKINPSTGQFIWNLQTALVLGGLGMMAGLLTGLLGVGGGFVIVPALRKVTNLNMQSIVATSLMIIFLVGGVSIAIHAVNGFDYPLEITMGFIGACMLGMLCGRLISRSIQVQTVQRIFALVVFIIAIYLPFST